MARLTCLFFWTSILLRSGTHGNTLHGHESVTKGAAWLDGLLKALQFMRHSSADAPGWMANPQACAVAVANTLQTMADEYLDVHVGYALSTACDHLNVHQDFGGKKTCAPIFADLACHFDGDKDYIAWCQQSGVALSGDSADASAGAATDACAEAASAECDVEDKQAKGTSSSKEELDNVEQMDSKDVHVGDAHFGSGASEDSFGGKSKADEFTAGSVEETNAMVDQIEKAQAAEEKRASYRALTRLRGVMTASYDNIAHSHMDNIHKYNQEHNWRKENHIRHLAEEEKDDVEKWAAQSQR